MNPLPPATSDRPVGGPLRALLVAAAERFGVPAIDRLWVFPPRSLERIESRVVVFAVFAAGENDRRRVFTAHYLRRTPERGSPTVDFTLREHGTAPVDRVRRVVDGVVARLDGDLAHAAPDSRRIAGDPTRWTTLLDSLTPPPTPTPTPTPTPDAQPQP